MDDTAKNLQGLLPTMVELENEHLQKIKYLEEQLLNERDKCKVVIEDLAITNEELKFVNQELNTVNSEYQKKISQLTEANTDLDYVISAIDIGIVFLDEQLAIRKYTPQLTHYFNVKSSDVGRSIHTIPHELDYAELLVKITHVHNTGNVIEVDVLTKSGEAVLLKIMPDSLDGDVDNLHQGVLITITNISHLRFVESSLVRAQEQFKALLISRSERLHHRIEKNQNITVLVIDDDDVDRKIIKRYLNSTNERVYKIIESTGVEEAINVLQNKNVDVCLLDYQLSDHTAEDFAKILRNKRIDVPIILLSGQEESSMNEDFLTNEIIDSISKNDLSKPLLMRSIDYVLERKEIKNIVQEFDI